MLNALRSLGPIDLKSLSRDAMLRWMLVSPFLLVVAIRAALGLASARYPGLAGAYPFYPLLLNSVLVLLNAPLFGMLVGFILLDERDDQTLIALQTTPLSLAGYFSYRIGLPLALTFLLTMITLLIAGVGGVDFGHVAAAGLLAALITPIFALALGAFAQNKVQGFALAKASGGVLFPSLAAFFLPAGWQWLCYLFPTYWPLKLFWALDAGEPLAWLYFAAGLLYLSALNWLLLRHFYRVMHR